MSVFVDGVNLTAMTNQQLSAIVEKLRESKAVADKADWVASWHQPVQARKAVQQAALHASAWEMTNTITTHSEASPESLEWSNLEGGHTHHQVPSFAKWMWENGFITA